MPNSPIRLRLDDGRRAALAHQLGTMYEEHFDEALSEFRATELINFFLAHLGPAVYNQAVSDARGYMLERLDDLDAEYHEPEPLK